jgi:histidinol-phosphate phosphatase family protein
MSVAAVFLDKDGTLVENVPYNADPARVRFAPGVGPALARLTRAGFRLFVVSNQPGVALGYFPLAALTPVSQRMLDLARQAGATLHGFYYCPHVPGDAAAMSCGCRKPAPGLLLQAAAQHDVELAASWMVGDILDDVEAGHRAGCRSVLVDNGNETEWVRAPLRIPDYVARDFADAAAHVAGARGRRTASNLAEHAR